MLDRLTDSLAQSWDGLEPLPPGWREIFEALQAALTQAYEEREQLTQAQQRTATELREQVVELEALRRARSAAESANLVRGQILATVSHSMRPPADALLGLSGLLRLGALLPTQRAYLDALHGAAEALRGILNDVSDFSRLESGTLPLEPIAFDLRVMVEDLTAALSGEALAKGLALRLRWDPDTPKRVRGDPGRIRQVLAVLVRDGLARLERGEVLLEVREDMARTTGGIRVLIEDSGPPIPDDLLATLFEPFIRGDAYSSRDGGLALPIARQLAHLMGGELLAENPTGGSGTRFTLRLPLPWSDATTPEGTVAGLPADPVPTSALPGTLLVVEADAKQRASWSGIAEAAGYRATGFEGRDAALAELARRAQDGRAVDIVIFSDHDAEEYERIGREISGDAELGKPALVMLPAVGNPGDARRLMDAGFRGYLVKPVAPADLRETLETLRRTPRAAWHTLLLTRHSLAEARRGEEIEDVEEDAGLTQLLET
ncbi:MAG TPA: hybrid sensor histidine kinase/response regulator [Gemmatimonadales bacterium]|nr:hybrid sensor histidine kinase/response regulator [Gemmatimonadales bacterium]